MAKKLDRGLANLQWRLKFPEAFIEVLCRLHSDHNPLYLILGGLPQARGPKPFRFEAAWMVHSDYQGMVQKAWEEKRESPWRPLFRLETTPKSLIKMFSVISLKGKELLRQE